MDETDRLLSEAAAFVPMLSDDLTARIVKDAISTQVAFLPSMKRSFIRDRAAPFIEHLRSHLWRPGYAPNSGLAIPAVLMAALVGSVSYTDTIGVEATASEVVQQDRDLLIAELDEMLFPLDTIAAQLWEIDDILADISEPLG